MEFYRNSTQTVELLKVFLSLSDNIWSVIFQYRSSRPEVFCEKVLLEFFQNSQENFAKFLRTSFLAEHLRWLLLSIRCFKIQNEFCLWHLIKVNKPWYKRCGITPHFPKTKKQMPKILLRRGVRERMITTVEARYWLSNYWRTN